MPRGASVVFIMLDATRADRLSSWGNPNRTTPSLDRLAEEGVVFRRHFANSHATRPSFPQLMTGRYYFQNVLRPFTPHEHPREFPFTRPDARAAILPGVLRDHGYQVLGASAHPWLVADSILGGHFDRLELVAADARRGYAAAADVVQCARALWSGRDRSRPVFLYVHFMDMHMPRHLPEGEPRFPVAGFDWRKRFKPSCEPRFSPERRRWLRGDARDFTALDRRHFAAVYDTRLAYTDEQVARLLDGVRVDDPGLARTLVVVTADHGEELGEDGRTDHGDSLADGVQHVPWIVSGADVPAGQQCLRFTENIDVLPTLVAALGLDLPPGTRVDGRSRLTAEGRLPSRAGRSAVYYAWETYRAIRTERHLLRQNRPGSFRACSEGDEVLYRLEKGARVRLDPSGPARRVAERLRRRLARRLDRRERRFLSGRYDAPRSSFVVRPEFWRLGPGARVTPVTVDATTSRRRLRTAGWIWSGRGVTVVRANGDTPLPVTLAAPDGAYRIEAAAIPIRPRPRLLGFRRWRRESFLSQSATAYLPLGEAHGVGGRLEITIPVAAAVGHHIVGLRLSPPGALEAPLGQPGDDDPELRLRLQALGYVE